MATEHQGQITMTNSSLGTLPNEVLGNIVNNLDREDLIRLSLCSSRFRSLTIRATYRSIDHLPPSQTAKLAKTIIASPVYGYAVRKWKITLPQSQTIHSALHGAERREQCALLFMPAFYKLLSRALSCTPNLEFFEIVSPYGARLPPHFFNTDCTFQLESLHLDGPSMHYSMLHHPSFHHLQKLSFVSGVWAEDSPHSWKFPASFAPGLKSFYGPPQILFKLLETHRPIIHASLIATRSAALPFVVASLKRMEALRVPLRHFTLRSERSIPLEELFIRLGVFSHSLRNISLSLNERAQPFLDTDFATRNVEPIVETFLSTFRHLTSFKFYPSSDPARRRAYGINTLAIDYQRTNRWKRICPSLSQIVLPSSRRASFCWFMQQALPAPPPGVPDIPGISLPHPRPAFTSVLAEPPWSTSHRRLISEL